MIADSVRRPHRMLLQWHITERCNCRCKHCYQQEERQCIEPDWTELVTVIEQFKDLLADLKGDAAAVQGQITVTGGEPFMRDDFFDLLELLTHNMLRFAILTNGSFISSEVAGKLARLRPVFVQVSLEGTEAIHDEIRGSGNYLSTIEAIRHLVKAGIRTYISFTAHRGNFREFHYVAELGYKLQVDKVWADRQVPLGQSANFISQMLTPEETREFFALMASSRQKLSQRWFSKTKVTMERGLQFLVGGGRPYRCGAGKTLLTVMPNGDVFPCRRMPFKLGNLLNTPLKDIYHTNEFLSNLRKTAVSGGCQGCIYAHTCAGGLKCLAFAVKGSPWLADPGCWYVKK